MSLGLDFAKLLALVLSKDLYLGIYKASCLGALQSSLPCIVWDIDPNPCTPTQMQVEIAKHIFCV